MVDDGVRLDDDEGGGGVGYDLLSLTVVELVFDGDRGGVRTLGSIM